MPEQQMYTPEELAEALRLSVHTIRGWLRSGKIRGRRYGRSWRIPAAEYQRVLDEGVPDEGVPDGDEDQGTGN